MQSTAVDAKNDQLQSGNSNSPSHHYCADCPLRAWPAYNSP